MATLEQQLAELEQKTARLKDRIGVTPEFGENSTLRNLVEYF